MVSVVEVVWLFAIHHCEAGEPPGRSLNATVRRMAWTDGTERAGTCDKRQVARGKRIGVAGADGSEGSDGLRWPPIGPDWLERPEGERI
jgi:hypothetical protein